MEEKSAIAKTKRRKYSYSVVPGRLDVRLARLAKTLKQSNPIHMVQYNAQTWNSISIVGTLFDLMSQIDQGDNYNQRFGMYFSLSVIGSHVDVTRIVIKNFCIIGGTTAAPQEVRVSVFRAQAGLAYANNMNSSYSPVVISTVTQLLYDRIYMVPPSGSLGWAPPVINVNLKCKHRQKFSGSGANTQTGETLYMIVQSGIAAGAGAPSTVAGHVEVYFKP